MSEAEPGADAGGRHREPGSSSQDDATEIVGIDDLDDRAEATEVEDPDPQTYQAYSAPESEHITSAPYVPADVALYDYENYDRIVEYEDVRPPRWPWVVGITAILAAVALVVSVSVLVTRTESHDLANPTTTTVVAPPVQDEITEAVPSPEMPPPPSEEPPPPPPPPPPPETVTVTPPPPVMEPEPAPPPPAEEPEPEPEPAPSTTVAPTTTKRAGPRQVTYSVTGTKSPGDIITVTYVDANGRSKTLRNVYIPWSFTVTPISQSEIGSVQASSLFLVSKLNCSITTSDGEVLSSNQSNSAQTAC